MMKSIRFTAVLLCIALGMGNMAQAQNKGRKAHTVKGASHRHECVDLGLPSGTLWATCNVGATTPEGYGEYFAWGETTPKTTCSKWSTYKYANGDEKKLTKYCGKADYGNNGFTDNLTILLPKDDAATANMGAAWRMPTEAEWEELLDNTTNVLTTQNGVTGWLFTAPNGNTLFLPEAGFTDHGEFVPGGFYWSSSLSTDCPYGAFGFIFNSIYHGVNAYWRPECLPVRAVRKN